MEHERGAENLPVDMNMSTGSPNAAATHVAREDCPHLADPEWEAPQRLSTVIGEAAVATMLRTLSPTEQHGVALGFIMKEQREVAARATVSTPSRPRVESLELDVNSYVGREGEPLLRWLVEVDTAITARRIVARCRSTHEVFKEEPRQAFELPQNEFRSRAEFLDLQQGKHDVHAYAQRARYLVSNIMTNPIDEATKVVTAMKGLKDVPVKTYPFREYPKRERSLQALVDCRASDNFVRLQSLARLDFEEVELPRSLLEVRLATGIVVRTQKRVGRVRFSYEEKTFVDELIMLDLDDRFDIVLECRGLRGMIQ
ncbi:unnamed protein product [Phytophthora fragariaefolia]|uniref:Unnamed protein product n=1 Tax=Phytophthora fragariaefolia TaxID=1490495 RepID=A0A9W6XA73_9STRA|nr:unnamed protein product [Phytophthora fragariaefolia]